MKSLRPLELEFWNGYLTRLPSSPQNPIVEANFAGHRGITDELIQLYLQGKKHAGSSLVKDFIAAGDPLPQVGNYWIILDNREFPRVLVKTTRIEINLFKNIPLEVVLAEGEGDLSIEYWKRGQ